MWWWLLLELARAEVVDRVVAVVEGLPVLASEVRLEEAMAAVDPSPVPFWTSSSDFQRTSIDAVVLRYMAADVALYQPNREALTERLDALREAFGDHAGWTAFLEAHGLDESRVEVLVRRRMIVERYLLRNVQSSPEDKGSWLAESDELIEGLRPRVRIRVVPGQVTTEAGTREPGMGVPETRAPGAPEADVP